MRLALPGTLPGQRRRPAGRDSAEWAYSGEVARRLDDRHSRRVALLKRLLPAIGLALLLLIAMWPRLAPLWERLRFAAPAIDLRAARELRMIHPRYAGVDRQGHPFVVTAAVGRQVPDRQDLMSLRAPRADIRMHDGAAVVVVADSGIYQQQVQLLDLFGHVRVVRQDGTRFLTDRARVDVARNAAQGDDPVSGHGPSGDIAAQGFRILDKGDTILFTGRSRLLLRSAKAGSVKTSPAALPPPVAATAAAIAAQAKPAPAAAARRARPGPARRQHVARHGRHLRHRTAARQAATAR
jgi:lipopolysaccharide export system protein LptC